MDDLRAEPRNHLVYYLRVFEQDGKTLFGHVVDVSSRGMLITSDRPMQRSGSYRLQLEDLWRASSLDTVPFEAECRWCKEDSGLFDGGFQITKTDPKFHALMAEAM